MAPKIQKRCPFCTMDKKRIIAKLGLVFAIEDTSPVSLHHLLIIPHRHCRDYFDMSCEELRDAKKLIEKLKNEILEKDPEVLGFNIGVNCGEVAGQTIFHTHIHLIPRRLNDTPSPRGGVRGVIPERMDY